MHALIFCLVLAAGPASDRNLHPDPPIFFDLIELNHFHDDQGKLIFDQFVFYDWNHRKGRHEVQGWSLQKGPQHFVRRDYTQPTASYLLYIKDSYRPIIATTYRECWTQDDPELVDREFLAKEKRRYPLGGLDNNPTLPGKLISLLFHPK